MPGQQGHRHQDTAVIRVLRRPRRHFVEVASWVGGRLMQPREAGQSRHAHDSPPISGKPMSISDGGLGGKDDRVGKLVIVERAP